VTFKLVYDPNLTTNPDQLLEVINFYCFSKNFLISAKYIFSLLIQKQEGNLWFSRLIFRVAGAVKMLAD